MIVDLSIFHPSLKLIYAFLITFSVENSVPLRVTSLHRSGDNGPHGSLPLRAFDFSVHGWHRRDIRKFKFQLENLYGYLGAKSLSDNVQRVIIFHGESDQYHGHIQCIP